MRRNGWIIFWTQKLEAAYGLWSWINFLLTFRESICCFFSSSICTSCQKAENIFLILLYLNRIAFFLRIKIHWNSFFSDTSCFVKKLKVISIPMSKKLRLKCTFTGPQKTYVSWYKDGKQLVKSQTVMERISAIPKWSQLQVHKLWK